MPAGMNANSPWTQTNKELTLLVPVGADVRAKEVQMFLTSQALKVVVRGAELVSGEFFLHVKPDDSMWELEAAPSGGKQLRIGVSKLRPNMLWDCLFLSEVDDSITHRVYMDIAIGGLGAGRVVFGLHGNACPRTCENFRCLCTGERGSVKVSKKQTVRLNYEGCRFHRVVPGFLVQGGDVTHSLSGAGGYSIYGETFADENFKIKHTGAGQLLMAGFGYSDNSQSQFAVALDHIKEFESKHVIFGKVLEGMGVLRAMELEGSGDGFTLRPIVISACGELDDKGQPIEEMRREDDAPEPAAAAPWEEGGAAGEVALESNLEGVD